MQHKVEVEGRTIRGRYASIIVTLQMHGPMTVYELAEQLGESPHDISGALGAVRAKHGCIHISGWQREVVNGRLYPRAVYAFGKRRDSPKIDPLPRTEYNRRYRESVKGRGVSSVFDLAKCAQDKRMRATYRHMRKS